MTTSSTDYDNREDYEHTFIDALDNSTKIPPTAPSICKDVLCVFLATVGVIIFILGIVGNSLVIYIAGFKIKKSVNTSWYLSLAVSDFLFCAFLPLNIVYLVQKVWLFGRFMCKFTSFILLLNMFSSIFLLVIISVDRCVVVMFPVWAQNKRSLGKASVVIALAWILSAALSSPAAVFREVSEPHQKCHYDYSEKQHIVMVISRFTFGFVIPFLVISACYVVIIRKLRSNQMARSTKPFKVMTLLIVVFFLCWLPYHIFNLMELIETHRDILHIVIPIGTTLVSSASFLNPFLYAFMGKDFKKKCYAILSKIENAIEEEDRSSARGTSFTNTGGKYSTIV
ncbi:chemerin-like receptor 1 [Trichomycterus rosablanca]|uniref:chemerin-like receptor 1 n=1 Tax=Trichomycterus rosablanca TaxID=2290929 RepID=UPI002F35145F